MPRKFVGLGTLPPGTVYVFSADCSEATLYEANQAKYHLGELVQICDGIADDIQIQAAIDVLPGVGGVARPSGGTIWLSEGTFNISSSIDFGIQQVTVQGAGMTSTEIRAANSLDADVLVFSGANWGTHIKDLAMNGNRDNQASGYLLNTTNSYNLTVERVEIRWGKDGSIYAGNPSEFAVFRSVKMEYSAYGFYGNNIQWYDFYDCTVTQNTTEGWQFYRCRDILLIGCTADQATGTDIRDHGFLFYNTTRLTAIHCRVFGDPTTSYLKKGFRIYSDDVAYPVNFIRLYGCEVHNLRVATGDGRAYELALAGTGTGSGVSLQNCIHTGTGDVGLYTLWPAPGMIYSEVEGCYFDDATAPVLHFDSTLTSGIKIHYNEGYFAPGEKHVSVIALTGALQNTIDFAWQNPHSNAILIDKIIVDATTPSTLAASMDIGFDADGTGAGTDFFDDVPIDAAGTYDSTIAGDQGQQTTGVLKMVANGGGNDWITGFIRDASGADLVGFAYIYYTGI